MDITSAQVENLVRQILGQMNDGCKSSRCKGEIPKTGKIAILTEPKNSLVKQYQKLFSLDGVNLQFTDAALEAIAQKAIDRKTGARGLRSIMEETLGKLMFELPSDETAEAVVIGEGCVTNGEPAVVEHNPFKKNVPLEIAAGAERK